jgi:hypothetical protein
VNKISVLIVELGIIHQINAKYCNTYCKILFKIEFSAANVRINFLENRPNKKNNIYSPDDIRLQQFLRAYFSGRVVLGL